jgi:excisionase family DNA binding protein
MPDRPLYVRLPETEAQLIDRAAEGAGVSKREVVSQLVQKGLGGDGGLTVGRLELRPADAEVLTLEQAAALLQSTDDAVRELAESGELPRCEVGGEWRFSRAAILGWLGRTSTAVQPTR